ncbi:tetratricopeptide repeat protein [Spirochaeta isovalerica]|uniref:Uncharacterized protein n=1 Tax=Spirochaeta isovalerica TaxID=150 RepID=A0A841R5L9_9SPIO|nr:hypothetical protein [Spirochaeta isovalerica]MBB6479126.1 hypothetical protein [Spirochaeta isovalerica]
MIILSSCVTTGEARYYAFNQAVENSDAEGLEGSVVLPEISLFVSAPYLSIAPDEDLGGDNEIILPEYVIPEIAKEPAPEPEKQERQTVIAESVRPVALDSVVETSEKPPAADSPLTPENIIIPEETVVTVEPGLSRTDEISPDVRESVNADGGMPDNFREFTPGEDILISLDREGWIFDRGDSSEGIVLKNRQFEDGMTRFLFTSETGGTLVLYFVLQNSETGEDEKLSYKLEAATEDSGSHLPVVIEALSTDFSEKELSGLADDDISIAVMEENVPGVVASIDQLTDPEADPGTDLMMDVFELLDKQGGYDQLLVKLAENAFLLYPYDNSSAEMLFRAAQSLENPGTGQDIEKAVTLFKLVRDHFPLSVYSDRSEERISYLERHFMKIY